MLALISMIGSMSSRAVADASTLEEQSANCCASPLEHPPIPGLLCIFSAGAPRCIALPLANGELELGRGDLKLGGIDPRMSRRHARVQFDGRHFIVSDLGSHNGSAADGEALAPNQPKAARHILRTGDTLFLMCPNLRPSLEFGVQVRGGRVLGPALQAVLRQTETAARGGNPLHILGASGTGKEGLAQAFHEHGKFNRGRLVAVNCAAIPPGLAERLLFGCLRGAYSGADTDAVGYIEAADKGTLFLDEIAELDLGIQAKLLRVLETKELIPLGAPRTRSVDFQVCSASNQDLRSLVSSRRFREDLYFRIGRPTVSLPPLHRRPEEIPWLIDVAIKRVDPSLSAQASLVETCLLRPWPGNVRELLSEIRTAAQTVLSLGCKRIDNYHLSADAGAAFADPTPRPADSEPALSTEEVAERARILDTLREHKGNISAAARRLGIHRTQLCRLLERYHITPQRPGATE